MKLPLRKTLFWDVDYDQLDLEKNKVYIAQQVLNYGTLEEFKLLMDYYGEAQFVEAICQVGWLDPKTFAFVTSYFHLPKTALKCYTKNRLNQAHWSS